MTTFYHCTYAKSLPAIARHGLRPGLKPALMRAAPGNHRGVYLSDWRGAAFWFQRLVDWAQNDSDNPVEDGLVPVVLKVVTLCDVMDDETGTRDSASTAVICPRPIVPGGLRVWDGNSWVRVSADVETSLGTEWTPDEDHPEGGYPSLRDQWSSPLFPPSAP